MSAPGLAYGAGMRRTPVLAPIAAVALCLAACGPAAPMPSPTPTVTVAPAPLFDSDEEALAAAEEVYREYLAVVDSGVDLEAIRDLATSDTVEREGATRDELKALGRHLEGTTVLRSMALQRFDGNDLTAYACLDLSGVRVRDELGTDVTPTTRPDLLTLEVTFVPQNGRFVIAESTLWSSSC